MREIIFQDQIARKRNKRLLCIHETFTQQEYSFEAERKSFFRLRKIYSFGDMAQVNEWICKKLEGKDKSRGLSVLRVYNKDKGINVWVTKQTGSLYIVRHNKVLVVSFLHKLKVEVHKSDV